jgi:hypothetical protein
MSGQKENETRRMTRTTKDVAMSAGYTLKLVVLREIALKCFEWLPRILGEILVFISGLGVCWCIIGSIEPFLNSPLVGLNA